MTAATHIGLLVATACLTGAAAAEPPSRVVSMNLCTDQLAMLVAGEDQLYSVSELASDPRGSAMAGEAEDYVVNHGLAEEIYLMRPDLVVAGAFSNPATLDMLRRLEIPVEVFDPVQDLGEVGDRLRQMGGLLGREDKARALTEDFSTRLASLRREVAERPSAALYYANGYTSGDHSLAGQILLAAGFSNIAEDAGYGAGGVMPLEVLALAAPEVLVTGERYPGASRSEEILDHPVLRDLRHSRAAGRLADRDWTCGTPYVLRAIEGLAATRDAALEARGE